MSEERARKKENMKNELVEIETVKIEFGE